MVTVEGSDRPVPTFSRGGGALIEDRAGTSTADTSPAEASTPRRAGRARVARASGILYGPALVALIVGIAFSFVAFSAMHGWEHAVAERRVEARFDQRAEHVSLLFQEELTRHLTAADAVAAFFEASVEVTRAEFDTFTRGLVEDTPGIRAIAWAPRVSRPDRAGFEARVGAELPGFQVREEEGSFASAVYPMLYLSPSGDPALLGLDVLGVPALREAAAQAAATGSSASVGRVPLALFGGGEGDGVAVVLPFYRFQAGGSELQGFVVQLVDLDALVGDALGGVDAWLTDTAGRPLATWLDGSRATPTLAPVEGMVRRNALSLGDQTWTLTVAPSVGVVPVSPGWASGSVLAVGLVASVLGAAYLARLRRFAADLEGANTALSEEMARRKEAERTRERLSGVVEATTDLVAMADPADHLLYLNRAGRALVGVGEGDDIGRILVTDLLTPACRAHVAENALRGGGHWQGEIELRRADGGEIPALGTFQTLREDGVEYRSVIAHDIRERKAAERELERHAYYDELTGLPNRRLLERRLAEAIDAAGGAGRVAVLLVSPDRFRFVNLSLGPAYRDLTLRALAQRLDALARPGETLAHYVGDTFAFVLPKAGPAQVGRLRDTLFEAMAEPLPVDGAEVRLGLSMGACLYPADGTDVASLLRHADAALERAMELGGGTLQLFTPDLHQRLHERVTLEAELRSAIEREELVLYYQPQLDLASGRIAGVEALLRWNHPRLGLLSPGEWVGVAEATRLILPIGDWAFNRACQQARAWREAGVPPLRIGVNVSSYQLSEADLGERIRRGMREGGIRPGELELEITESALMADPAEARELLAALRDTGCRIAIDDFGTGYSSLSYLKQLPVDQLKIDQSFIRDVTTDMSSAGIVRAIVTLAGNLGLATLAEGVSNTAQMDFLRREGCKEVQGYVVSRPVPAEEVPGLEASLRTRPILAEV